MGRRVARRMKRPAKKRVEKKPAGRKVERSPAKANRIKALSRSFAFLSCAYVVDAITMAINYDRW